MSTAAAKGVKDVVRSTTDLSKEPAAINGRLFRFRQLDIEPGGIVPWHSHGNRPAMIYIVSGEVIEYASNCAVPIVHKTGDVAPEKNGTQHWWQNTTGAPVVLISVDLFPVEMMKDDHMTCQSDAGSGPSGFHICTAKITESWRGLSSSTASIGVFE